MSRTFYFFLCIGIVCCFASPTVASDWSQWGRDAGRSSATSDQVEPPLKILWSFNLGLPTPPVVQDGIVYITGIKVIGMDVQTWIYALDEEDGSVLWRHRGAGPLAISRGILIGMGDNPEEGRLIALRNGTEIWTQPIGTTDAPLILGSKVIAGQVTANDLETGTLFWRYEPEVLQDDADHLVMNRVMPLSAENSTVVVATQHVITYYPGHPTTPIQLPEPKPGEEIRFTPPEPSEYATTLTALDLTTGNERWKKRIPITMESAPIVDGGKIFIGSNGSAQSYALDSGEELWNVSLPSYQRTLATGGGLLFVDELNGQDIRALSIKDGSEKWTYPSEVFYRHITLSGGILYCSGSPNYPSHRHVLEAVNASTGELLWRGLQTTQYLSVSQPVIDRDSLFLTAQDAKLYALTHTPTDTWEEIGSTRVTFTAIGELPQPVGTPSFGVALAIGAVLGVFHFRRRRGNS